MKLNADSLKVGRNDAVNGMKGKDGKRAFANKPVLVAAAIACAATLACTPDVTVKNIGFDPDNTDTAANCTTITDCSPKTGRLREEGNSAGPNTMKVGDATVTLVEVVDQGNTKAATVEIEGCGLFAESTLVGGGQNVTLTIGNDSFMATINPVEFDASGALVTVIVAPICDDAGVPGANTN